MIKLSEEQRAILRCYSGTKEEVMTELRKAIPFFEDVELREMSEDILSQAENMTHADWKEISEIQIKIIYSDSIFNE